MNLEKKYSFFGTKKWVKIMAIVLSLSIIISIPVIGTAFAQPTWIEYLDDIWDEKKSEWNWETNTGGAPVWSGSTAAPTLLGNVWQISTGEQLAWISDRVEEGNLFENFEIRLMNDIDLGGRQGKKWKPIGTEPYRFKGYFNGNNKVIYNLNIDKPNEEYVGLFSFVDAPGRVYDVTLASAKIKGRTWVSAFCSYSLGVIDNICVKDSLLESTSNGNSWIAPIATFAGLPTSTIDRCSSINNVVYGAQHVGGAFSAVDTVRDSFSFGCTVISKDGHSGGFISCTDQFTEFSNCFSNNEVYGNMRTGMFIGSTGAQHRQATIKNCFATGTLEGQSDLGGFCGIMTSGWPETFNGSVSIENCYSTVIVGMMSGGENMGSFVGNVQSTNLVPYTFKNCYAAGEVGHIDTDVSPNRTSFTTIGGFMGVVTDLDPVFSNCYYDKQTTAMREWAVGKSQNFSGIKGVLTTNTTKSGTGLISSPGTSGFTGFSENSQWVFKEGHYPQLKVFEQANFTNTNWLNQNKELNDFIKAYSSASTATVKLGTYDKDYAGNTLPQTTYDTVRDLTAKFPLTSENNLGWERCGVTGQGATSNGTGAKSDAFKLSDKDTPKDVLDLFKQDGVWYGDKPMPGIDWLKVSVKVGEQTGIRKLRICPTVGIDAGLSRSIARGDIYDHADDMRIVYSTGARMAAKANDFTYGVFPDDPLESRQESLLNASAYANTSALKTKYLQAGQNDAFKNIDTLYMQRTGTSLSAGVPTATTSSGGKLNEVIISEVLAENSDGSLVMGNNLDLSNPVEANRWNGNSLFATDSIHKVYSVQYVWSLADGRYIMNSKRIEYPTLTHAVTLSVENPSGIRMNDKAYLNAYSISTTDGKHDTSILPNFGNTTKDIDRLLEQPHAHPAAVSWKLDTKSDPVKKVLITVRTLDGKIEKTTEILGSKLPTTAGQSTSFELTVPYRAYNYDANNNPIWKVYEIKKTYSVTLNASGEYTIKFDKEYADYEHNVFVDDIDMDIDVVLVIDGVPPIVIDVETEFNFTNERQDKPWAGSSADVVNDMPALD